MKPHAVTVDVKLLEQAIERNVRIYFPQHFRGVNVVSFAQKQLDIAIDLAPMDKKLQSELVAMRRKNELSSEVNVYYNKPLNVLHINADRGRARRPYIVAPDGKTVFLPGTGANQQRVARHTDCEAAFGALGTGRRFSARKDGSLETV